MGTSNLLAQLKGVRKTGPDQWEALCSAHDDHRPSLSVREENGRTLLRCHAGCTTEAVVAALGLTMSDLFPESEKASQRQIVMKYPYKDEAGELLYEVVKTEPKGYYQQRPDGNGGWIRDLKGVRRVLYRLPELLAADPSATVFVVEGEKDADELARLGLVVTTNSGGAGKWRKEYSACLQGRSVVVIPDNDEPGRKHAGEVTASLLGVAASVKTVNLPGVPEKGDVSDWLKSHAKEELVALGEAAPRSCAVPSPRRTLYTAADLLSMDLPEPRWVVEGIVPEGLTLLAGKPKVGKSWLCLQLALSVAGVDAGLGGTAPNAGGVLYLALEDSNRRLRYRLAALLVDKSPPAALHLATEWPRLPAGGLDRLQSFLREHPETRLFVIDTLARVRATSNGRKSAYEIDYGDLSGLQSLAAEHPGLGVLVVHHQRKNLADDDPLDLVSGTTGLTACADTVILMSRGRGTDSFDARMLLTGRDVEGREFALKRETGSPRWCVLGDASALALSEQQQKIVAFLRKLGEPAGPKAIADATCVPHGSVKHLVGKLVDVGILSRAGSGTYAMNPGHSAHSNHRVHPIHSVHPPEGVSTGECPSYTDGVKFQIEESSRGEQGERSSDEIDSPKLGGRGTPAHEPSDQDAHGGEP